MANSSNMLWGGGGTDTEESVETVVHKIGEEYVKVKSSHYCLL